MRHIWLITTATAGALLAGVILLVSPLARLQEPPPEEG